MKKEADNENLQANEDGRKLRKVEGKRLEKKKA